MESVLARENIKLMIKNWLEADITHLRRIDCDVFVLLLSLLLTKELS
jgi:hypothetical protein